MAQVIGDAAKTIADENGKVETALGLLDSEAADAIIGEPGEGYQELVQGTRSAMTMLWALMKSFGVRETPKTLKAFAQAMSVVLTLVHYAYALGVKHGKDGGKD